jgi:hypothetical protein
MNVLPASLHRADRESVPDPLVQHSIQQRDFATALRVPDDAADEPVFAGDLPAGLLSVKECQNVRHIPRTSDGRGI